MKNIAVFFGGKSVEHDVSVITGVLTCNTLDTTKYNVIPVYCKRSGEWVTGEILLDPDGYGNLDDKKLKRVTFIAGENVLYEIKGKKLKPLGNISCAVNCMHGERGEDGSLAGIANMCDIALTSSDISPSAVAMDKTLTKRALKGVANLLPYVVIDEGAEADKITLPFSYPVIVKPANGGSSIGIKTAENVDELVRATEYALRFDKRVIIEPCLPNFTEINCAVYRSKKGIVVSECEKPIRRTDFLTFSDKYESGKRVFPADVPKSVSDKIKATTEKVYSVFGFSGVIRIDYFLSDGKIYLNEINAVPGSLSYYLFSEKLKDFTAMTDELISVAEERRNELKTLKTDFESGILRSVGAKSAKRL